MRTARRTAMRRRRRPSVAVFGTLLLVVPMLAGCASLPFGGDGGDGATVDLPWDSYQQARDAPGETFEPVNSSSTIRLKLLQPRDPSDIDQGGLTVRFLLFDSDADVPVTDADFSADREECSDDDAWCARMPAMGHGTSPETSPTHVAFGVYEGTTTISMGGGWLINVNPTLPGGSTLNFDVALEAAGGGGGGTGGPPDPKTFGSFQEALDASGTEHAPTNTANLTTSQPESDENITTTSYSNGFAFTVGSLRADRIDIDVIYQPGAVSATDQLTFNLSDPNGTELENFTATPDEPTGTITVSDVNATGEYTVGVSGQSTGGSYDLFINVSHTLTLKLLDPEDPSSEDQGKQPFVFLLYDQDDGMPAEDATIEISPWMPSTGQGSSGNEAPSYDGGGTGTYTGFANYTTAGEWTVNVTAALDNVYRYEVPVTVS